MASIFILLVALDVWIIVVLESWQEADFFLNKTNSSDICPYFILMVKWHLGGMSLNTLGHIYSVLDQFLD